MSAIEDKLTELIQPLCEGEGIFLGEVSLHGSGRNRLVKVIVDTESGINLSQCQELSKKISDIFYRKDMFQGDYRLEVSSPGADKPLVEDFEYKRSIGKDLVVNYHLEGVSLSVSGELLNFDGESITLRQKKDDISILISDIDEAKIKLKW